MSRSRGGEAEKQAAIYLQQQGLRHIASNVTFKGGELDLVMMDKDQLVFIEVRLRRHSQWGGAAASVTIAKQRKLLLAAQLFLQRYPHLQTAPCRFDVIAFEGTLETTQPDWYKNAFTA